MVSISLPSSPVSVWWFPLLLAAAAVFIALLSSAYSAWQSSRPWPDIPVMCEPGMSPKRSWAKHGNTMMKKGLEQHRGAFQVITGIGPRIVLPNKFADETRNDPRLNAHKPAQRIFCVDLPGFEGFRALTDEHDLVPTMIRGKLTHSLGLITDDLVDETIEAVHDVFGDDEQWQAANLREACLDLVARQGSRVFLGKKLCRNQDWLRITKGYAVNAIDAAREMRMCPPLLRRIMVWFLPGCTKIRKQYKEACQIVLPDIMERKLETEKILEAGGRPPKAANVIGWLVDLAHGMDFDHVGSQLGLSIAAIHTSTEALTQALMDLCEHEEVIQQLRDEIVAVLGPTNGWAKTSLYQLRLMDSFLKESQRLHRTVASMSRVATEEIQLSDGTIIPRDSHVVVGTQFFEPTIYPEPHKFDVTRFVRKREEPGQSNRWQYATTSAAHMGFGHGFHACPGRFFVANELKIALCHLLLKYDWSFVEGEGRKASLIMEGAVLMDPNTQIRFRRRKEEIDLSGNRSTVIMD